MPVRTKRRSQEIIPSPARALTVLSSSLVLRGLRELPQTPRWNVRQVFAQHHTRLAISSQGRIAAYSAETPELSQCVEIADAELSGRPKRITVPGESRVTQANCPAAFAWNPTGKIFAAASDLWQPELHLFEATEAKFAGRFGAFHVCPTHLCWSESGKYLVVSSDGSEKAKLALWRSGDAPEQFQSLGELDSNISAENSTADDDQGSFFGFGSVAFRPDEKVLAAVLELDGEWSDDAVLLLRVPTLEISTRLEASGQVTQISWSSDVRRLIFCASGQACSADPRSGAITSLPFAAEMCQCHPSRPLCAFYNSWSKNSAAARIFIVDLQRNSVIDECRADGIADIRWSDDGRTLYCVARDGMAYLFDCPLS